MSKKPEKKDKKKRIKKLILTLVFIAFNITVIIITAVNEFSGKNEAADLSEVHLNGLLIIPAAICFMGMITLEYWKYALMMLKSKGGGGMSVKEAWKIAWRTVMIGRYYDRITPAAVGGQPAQILNMRKSGKVPAGLATAIPIFSMISGQVTFLIIAVPCLLISNLITTNPLLYMTAWIGLLFYAFWPVMVTGSAVSPKFTAKIINFIVKILAKIKIVKNENETTLKVEKEVKEYTKNIRLITKNPLVGGGVIIMSLFSNILISLVPFFVLLAFGGNIDFMECFVLSIAVQAAVYFAPTPGNSGVAEGTFYVVFSRLSSGYVFWAMLIWRLFSYYIYIIFGPLVYLFIHLEKKKHKKSYSGLNKTYFDS